MVVSKCLTGGRCRYDGEVLTNDFVENLRDLVHFKPVCPEMEIGLGCPRPKIRVIETARVTRLYQPRTRRDLTIKMAHFSRRFLAALDRADGFILQSRSPSCGIRDAAHFPTRHAEQLSGRGFGFFGRAVLQHFSSFPVEDETRLADTGVRKRFLTRLFAAAALHRALHKRSLKVLTRFHGDVTGFLAAYSKTALGRLAAILCNDRSHRPATVLEAYREEFLRTLGRVTAQGPRFPGTPIVSAGGR